MNKHIAVLNIFLHYKIQQIQHLLSRLSDLNTMYAKKLYQFTKEFSPFIDDAIEYFKQVGDSGNQAEMEKIKNFFQTAEAGIDPVKMERVTRYRRDLTKMAAFHCLSGVTTVLQNELSRDRSFLDQARDTLGSLVISLLQSGAISEEEISGDLNQDQLEIIWHRLSQHEQIKLHERNLKLNITQEDIFLLFADIMEKIK